MFLDYQPKPKNILGLFAIHLKTPMFFTAISVILQ